MSEPMFTVEVTDIKYEADGILSFYIGRTDKAVLPVFEPGAHIDVCLPNGITRSYSLSSSADDLSHYRLTIVRDAESKGGSAFFHDHVKVGDVLEVSNPRNNFTLTMSPDTIVFIAGGIGITPFLSMIAALNNQCHPWKLFYSARSLQRMAFKDELTTLAGAGQGELIPHITEVNGGKKINIRSIIAESANNSHFYCCGPLSMLDAFRTAAHDLGVEGSRVHYEYFETDVPAATTGGFSIYLAKSDKQLEVASGQSILDAVLESGVEVEFSCRQGTCGACETPMIEGEGDHRDMILSEDERAANESIMICCSGSRSPRLILDL